MPVTNKAHREFAQANLEKRLRRLELHCIEEMETALRTLYPAAFKELPERIRDIITLAAKWGCSIGQDARVEVVEEPTPDNLLWEDEPTPVYNPAPPKRDPKR